MKLHLFDTNPDLVECWQKEFAHFPEVEIGCDNLLDHARCCVVSPGNSYGYMDGGIDWDYIQYFGEALQVSVQEAISHLPEGKLPVGQSLLVGTGHARIPFLIAAPTMEMPMPIRKNNCYHAMRALLYRIGAAPGNLDHVYCPGLGTGVGHVSPEDAADEMAHAYRDWLLDKYKGCLMGLAVGDAVGTSVEFKKRGSFETVTDMTGGGPFRLDPGEWTDDTSMALCLAESLIKRRDFDPLDQMERYVRWWKFGHLSATGKCFDIGNTVRRALRQYKQTRDPYSGSETPDTAGNGSIMRLGPIPMFYALNLEQSVYLSGESSRTTHGARACIDACRYLGALITGALRGDSKERLLSSGYPSDSFWVKEPLCSEISQIARGSFKEKNRDAIRGSGYVVQSLEAALWCFHHSTTFEEGCLLAVNLGDDADTTTAVYGQVAGAFYGYRKIRRDWREKVARRDVIEKFARRLFECRDTTALS